MGRKIRVLHILWSGGIGGTEEYIINLIKHLDPRRYENHLCFLSQKGQIYEEINKSDSFRVDFIGIKSGYDIFGAVRFAKFLLRNRFDIIHSHMRNILSSFVLTAIANKTPKVLTHHVGPIDVRLFRKNRLFYKLYSGSFRKISAISNAVKENLVNDLGYKYPELIEVVYNGVDLKKFNIDTPISSDFRDLKNTGNHIIGFIGRMEYFKRPALFIEVAEELIKKNRSFYFVMVGNGSEMEKCKNMIHNRNINENFKLLGFRRDIPNLLKLFDALLFTSAGEGFGIVLIEAMAMGVPVFAVNDGAVSEIIKHKENGILLNTADPKIIAKEINEVLNDNTLINRIKLNAIDDVRNRFSIEASVRKTERIYNELLK